LQRLRSLFTICEEDLVSFHFQQPSSREHKVSGHLATSGVIEDFDPASVAFELELRTPFL
jgi:hypothetical protein